jgi:secreted PhoX family phosphatase
MAVVTPESTDPEMTLPEYVPRSPMREQVDGEPAARGVTVVELVRLTLGGWRYHRTSDINRRITGETAVEITGPAAGHGWLKISYDAPGMRARGAINDRDGGVTPWGTYLTCEANCRQYFANTAALPDDAPRKGVHARRGLPTGSSHRRWECYQARFDLVQEPNEPFRFGWVAGLNPRPVSPISPPVTSPLTFATTYGSPLPTRSRPRGGTVACTRSRLQDRSAGIGVSS